MSSITLLTDVGRGMLAAFAAGGSPYTSAIIAIGDANGTVYVPNVAQTGLVHEVWRGAASVAQVDDQVVFQCSVPANVGGFMVREVGVYLGAAGAESLFIISQHPTTEKLATPANGAGPLPISITFNASGSQIGAFPIGLTDNAVLSLSRAPHITVDNLVTVAPVSPANGVMVAIGAGATGTFAGKAGYLAERVSGAWVYDLPPERSVIRIPNGSWYERVGSDWGALDFNPSIAWGDVTGKPTTFPPSPHSTAWADLTGVPATFAPVPHTHPQSDVTNLVADLAGKLPTSGTAVFNGASFSSTATSAIALTAPVIDLQATSPTTGVELGRSSGQKSYFGHSTSDHTYIRAGGIVHIGDAGATAVQVSRAGVETVFNGPVRLNTGVGLSAGGSIGTSSHVLVGGAAAAWKSLSELGVGKKLLVAGGGTALVHMGLTVTLPTAEPDALYSVVAFCIGTEDNTQLRYDFGTVSKTATGFTITTGWVYTWPYNVKILYIATR